MTDTLVTFDDKHIATQAAIITELKNMNAKLVGGTRLVYEWASQPIGGLGSIAPGNATTLIPVKEYSSDVVITGILATWPIASTSAILHLGDFVVEFPPALGFVNITDMAIKLDGSDVRRFDISPAGPCSVALCGHVDIARVGFSGGQRA